jgi:hypothetical protein
LQIKLLLEVYEEDEKKRFARFVQQMKERGGCKAWDWGPGDIEAKLVELRVEDLKMDDDSKDRRRRRNELKKIKDAAAHQKELYYAHAQAQMMPATAQFPMAHMSGLEQSHYEPYPLTAEEHEELMEQMERKYHMSEDDEGSSMVDSHIKAEPRTERMSMEMDVHSSMDSNDLSHRHSERVARQACHQMMHKYGGQQ